MKLKLDEVGGEVEEVKVKVRKMEDKLEDLECKIEESNQKNSRDVQNLPKNEQGSQIGKFSSFLAFID